MLDPASGRFAPPSGPISIRPPRFRWASIRLNKVISWGYRLRGKHRYDEFLLEWVEGVPLLVMPSVFNPKLLLTGSFFASQLDSRLFAPDADVLDMGTGSGICAVFAAKYARRIVAVDINCAAVRCAGINALMNRVEHKIDVRHGDLFAPVGAEQFDLILFNPPFLRGHPTSDRDRAWRSSDVPERFASGLGRHLKASGYALVLLSTFGGSEVFLGEFRRHGFCISIVAERRLLGETVAIFKLQAAQPRRLV